MFYKIKKPEDFPVGECIVQDEEDIRIFEGKFYYWCWCIDKRFKNEIIIKKMKPYICKEPNGEDISFGWIDENRNWIDNLYNPIHYLDEFVFGYQRIATKEEKEHYAFWEELQSAIKFYD